LRENSKFYDAVIVGDVIANPPIANSDNKYQDEKQVQVFRIGEGWLTKPLANPSISKQQSHRLYPIDHSLE
jgi:hypothetical protein